MTMLFNVQNHRNLLQAEIDAAHESMDAYGLYCTVVVDGKLVKARRDSNGTIIGSYTAGAETFEVFTNDAAAAELVKWHQSHGQFAKAVRVDSVLSRYISHLRAAVSALGGAIDL